MKALPNTTAALTVAEVTQLRTAKAAQAVKRLFEVVHARGMYCYIGWRWVGWDRSGVLVLEDEAGQKVKFAYTRGNIRWGNNDDDVERIRTGSRKHAAVLQALAHLAAS